MFQPLSVEQGDFQDLVDVVTSADHSWPGFGRTRGYGAGRDDRSPHQGASRLPRLQTQPLPLTNRDRVPATPAGRRVTGAAPRSAAGWAGRLPGRVGNMQLIVADEARAPAAQAPVARRRLQQTGRP